jgi:hypothetical protein
MCGIPAKKSRDRLDNGLLIDVPRTYAGPSNYCSAGGKMKTLRHAWVVLLPIVLLLAGCSNRADREIGKIKKGMSEFEVMDILGVPDKARTDFRGLQTGPLGASTLFMYRGSSKWYRIIIFGSVLVVDSTADDSEDPQFPVEMTIVQKGRGDYEYRIRIAGK